MEEGVKDIDMWLPFSICFVVDAAELVDFGRCWVEAMMAIAVAAEMSLKSSWDAIVWRVARLEGNRSS